MNEIMFSIVLIARNEEKTLPRLLDSLKEYRQLGGDIAILDTGSTDQTVTIAREAGCNVTEVGEKYLHRIDKLLANKINKNFIVDNEPAVVKEGDVYFDFASARNHAASLAKNDIVFFYDADEVATKLDIEKINECIRNGENQFEYNFVFAHDQFGNEAVKFIQSKAYNRTLQHWTGLVHEIIVPIKPDETGIVRQFLDESIYKLSHFQNHETGRHTYLKGLAVDCYLHPTNDRNSHYCAREFFWSGRHKSAIKEFKRHISMNGWVQERSQSMIFIGDCYGQLNNPDEQAKFYSKAFYIDSSRREALLKLAGFFLHNRNYQAAVCYAKASLEIPYNGFYATNMSQYTFEPHDIMYQAYGWLGNIPAAQEHIQKCLDYQPYNKKYLADTKYYFEYPDNGIDGWMWFKEQQFLYNIAKKYDNICEVGSWKGKSTHALCSGHLKKENPIGTIFAVDTWKGSDDVRDDTNWMAKQEDVFEVFKRNTKQFTNLQPIQKSSVEAAESFNNESLDVVFIDAGHTYKDVRSDIVAWLPKVKKGGILCGHDYTRGTWQEVVEAVNDSVGVPDEIHGSIWVHYVK